MPDAMLEDLHLRLSMTSSSLGLRSFSTKESAPDEGKQRGQMSDGCSCYAETMSQAQTYILRRPLSVRCYILHSGERGIAIHSNPYRHIHYPFTTKRNAPSNGWDCKLFLPDPCLCLTKPRPHPHPHTTRLQG